MLILIVLLIFLSLYGFWEYRNHRINLNSIPIRIHVNGTRGKSSVTRLIAGGLRAGDIKTIAKTTGTKPRFIFEDGTETAIIRAGKPNIIEQIKIVRRAVSRGAEAIVFECMAVQPVCQRLSEHKMLRSTLGVITNVRPDHLDEMGPTLDDVAEALSNTIPANAVIFTAERRYLKFLEEKAQKCNSKIVFADPDLINGETMTGFTYLEHRDNVALALAACEYLGVKRETALQGMYQAQPDPGVLRIFKVVVSEKEVEFVNAFAANDSDSYQIIWNLLKPYQIEGKKLFVIVCARKDRIQRSEQLGELIAQKLWADKFLVVGEYTSALITKALASGLSHHRIINLGGWSVDEIFEWVLTNTSNKSLVVGIGNIVGLGEKITAHFANRGKEIAYGRN